MTTYELMIKTNEYLLKGGSLTDRQKQNIVGQFLSAVSSRDEASRFYKGVRFPNNIDSDGRRMYPVFYIPPYNEGKKYQTVTTITPKTHILSANSYELEIIRLLHILDPENKAVCDMVKATIERLKTACFGKFCEVGECFESSEIVLRFIAEILPNDTIWALKLMTGIKEHMNDKHRHWGAKFYYWLCLSELPEELAKPEILLYKDELLKLINRSFVMNSTFDDYASPLCKYIVRNCLARLEEYSYIKDRVPYVNEKDGRLYLNMEA